jgi:hypothetical protein
LLIAAWVNLGATLAGPAVMLTEPESIPRALAWGLIVLAVGLLAREKPLLAGLAGGVALIYQLAIAGPFWVLCVLILILDRRLRHLLRPAMTVLAVFILLLANLAQLQPGVAEQQTILETISAPYKALQQFRTPQHWVSLWTAGEVWSYLAVWVCGVWAVARIWRVLNRQSRWLFAGLPACGLLSIPISYLLLDRLHLAFVPHIQPTSWLLFTILLSSVACFIAGVRAAQHKKFLETALWFLLPFAMLLRAEVLDLLRLTRFDNLERLSIAVLLACVSAFLLIYAANRSLRPIALALPLLAMGLLRLPICAHPDDSRRSAVIELGTWVKSNTWGSSMFLFPDLGRSADAGVFRAISERSVWVDWPSGDLIPYFESLAGIWWDRWQQTIQPGYSPQRLHTSPALPIDYYVLLRTNRLARVKPVFENEDFLLYDANDLRNSSAPLHSAP